MTKKNPIEYGVIGRQVVELMADEFPERGIPVDMYCLRMDPRDMSEVQYRITFDNGNVSDWKAVYESSDSQTIVRMECFNEVIG